jgi:hypothetical protein
VVLDLFFGAAEHRLLLGHLPMTGEFITEVVDVILAGVARPEDSKGSKGSKGSGRSGRPGHSG